MSAIYDELFRRILRLVEKDVVPDTAIRAGIRFLISKRVRATTAATAEEYYERLQDYVDDLRTRPIAEQQDAANEQHYEVPTEYYVAVLGQHRKYSSCLYPRPNMTLEEAEVEMLELTCQRAQLREGFDGNILELGCGWGSLSLFMAAKYPKAKITAISNSKTQKKYIDEQAEARGLDNLTVKTQDVVTAEFPKLTYDRVVSIEMFEHMKNYETLLRRISSWLKPGGMLFVHIFVHQKGLPFHYVVESEDDWMTKHFFAGGQTPSADLLLHFQDDLSIVNQWYVNGVHYSRTLEDWLVRHTTSKAKILPLFEKAYGSGEALRWYGLNAVRRATRDVRRAVCSREPDSLTLERFACSFQVLQLAAVLSGLLGVLQDGAGRAIRRRTLFVSEKVVVIIRS